MTMERETKEDSIFEEFLSLEEIEEKSRNNESKEGLEEAHSSQKHAKIKEEIDVAAVNILQQSIKLEERSIETQYESRLQKNYAMTSENNHHEDVKTLFDKSCLDFEKQTFYQNVFNDVLEKSSQKKPEDLQKKYVEHLRKISHIELFDCLSCDYRTMNKLNLKSHLMLVHKSELESTIFQCLNCKYKTKNFTNFEKHAATHEEAVSDNNCSDFEAPNSPKASQKRNKISKRRGNGNKCDLCTFIGSDKKSLESHKETHKSEKGNKFKCYVCSYEICSKIRLRRHLLEEHNITTFGMNNDTLLKCEFCSYTTESKACLKIHSLSHKDATEINWFYCTECKFQTKFKRNLHNHVLAVHKPEEVVKKFLCEVCSKSFSTRNKLTNHSLTHKSIDEVAEVFQCDQCPYKTKKKYNLKIHMVVHNAASCLRTFVCDTCGFQTKRKWNYDHHVLIHKDASELEMLSCNICGYKTKFRERLTRHMKRGYHENNRNRFNQTNYNCSVCNFEAARKSQYFEHIQIHDNPEEISKKCIACDLCEYRTSDKRNLSKHYISHKSIDEVRIFKCTEEGCDFQTKYNASLHTHVKGHKGITPVTLYKCDICGLHSKRKYDHNMHLITHKSANEVEVYSCTVCSYQTKFKAYLKAHLKKRHNIVANTRVLIKN